MARWARIPRWASQAAAPARTRQDALLHGASVLHIAPTVLYALGCAVPRQMDGAPLTNAFQHPAPVTWSDVDITVPAEDHTPALFISGLEALGYRDPLQDALEKNRAVVERERVFRLSDLYLATNRGACAIEVLEAFAAQHAGDTDALLKLCYTYLLSGRAEQSRAMLERIPETPAYRAILAAVRASLAINDAALGDALLFTHDAEENDPGGLPLLSVVIGSLYLDAKRFDAAERVFRQCAERFPDCWPAHEGHAKALSAMGQLAEATHAQQRSASVNIMSADSHTRLAFLLLTQGDDASAARAFRYAAALT